ncbi:MAG: ATP-binding protein [Flavitalea sp.]
MSTQTTIETLHRIILEKQDLQKDSETSLGWKLAGINHVTQELGELNQLLQQSGGRQIQNDEFVNNCLLLTSNRLLHVLQNLDYAICVGDENNKVLFVNQRFCDIFQLHHAPFDYIGKECSNIAVSISEFFKQSERFSETQQAIMKQSEPVRGEQWDLKNGKILLRDYNPIFGSSSILGHVWIYEDITERVTAELKLEEQRKFYEDVLNKLPSDVAVLNTKREYVFVNQAAIRDPFVREWIIGKRDEDYFRLRQLPTEMLEKRVGIVEDVLKTGELKKWEEKFVLPDGRIKHHLRYLYPMTDDKGNVKLLIGYGMEITDQKKAEEQIQRSEKRYRDLFNYSQALICTHDMHGRMISVNPAICKLLEYDEDELVGRLISDFIPADHEKDFGKDYLEPILSEGKYKGVFCVVSKSGNKIFLLYKNYKVEEEGLEPYIIGFSQDITDRVESEKKLLLAKKMTEDTARAKEVFLANMSHEIRTPMNGVLGFASLLVKTELNEQQKGYLKMIQESANNLLLIVNDVLDLEKILMGKLKFEHIDFPIAERIEMCVQSFTYKAEEKGIALKTEISLDHDAMVIGDPYRLSQVLNNLISNAIKFTDKGSVQVKAAVHNSSDAFLWLEFSVTDTGIGIPVDKHKDIFEPFMQANSAVTRKYGGTGLGLSICRELIQLMGGQLFLESEPGKGSTFRFVLPFGISVYKPKNKNMSQEINYQSLGRKRILVAEDVELNQYLARHIMESWGFEVDIAVNGREAYEKVQTKEYDLVLMDIQMPEMDGMEATEHIRGLSDKHKSGIPIVALTANALKGDSEKYMAVGMNDYLSKPFDESRLFMVISKNLEARASDNGAAPVVAAEPAKTNVSNSSSKTSKASEEAAAAKAPVAEIKVYNLAMVEAISGGDKDFVVRMAQLFLDTMPESLNEMKACIQYERWDALGKLAHKMKSTIDSMGIADLKQVIRLIEANGKNGTNDQTPALVDQVLSVMQTCMDQVRRDYNL